MKILLLCSVAAFASLGFGQDPSPATPPKEAIPVSHFDRAHAADLAVTAKNKQFDLVLIGDSITAGWDGKSQREILEQALPGKVVLNLGISGDVTQGVLWRLEDGVLDGVQAKVVMVMIGTNNIGRGQSEDIATGIKEVVRVLRAKVPDSKILLLGVFPRGGSEENWARKKTREINALIQDLHDGESVFYRDLAEVFLNKDGTPKGMQKDTLHLEPVAGYSLWIEAVKPTILQLSR